MSVHISRLRASLRRWFSILFCGLLGGTFVAALTALIARTSDWLLSSLAPIPSALIGLAPVLAAVALLWRIGRGRWLGLFGLRDLLSYPPLWLAVLVGLVAWAALIRIFEAPLSPDIRATSSIFLGLARPSAVVVAGLILASWCAAQLRKSPGRSADPSPPQDLAGVDFDWIQRWARTDQPIASVTEDQFGHRVVAERIARRLSSPGEPPTLALIGPTGSGKTTIKNLTKELLRSERDVIYVDLSLWPFENPEAAVRGILDALVVGLSSRIDAFALTEVRQQYLDAVGAAASRLQSVAALLQGRRQPKEHLETIGEVAVAIGVRVIVWIEDLERFSGSDRLSGDAQALREVEVLGPVRALLYLLDQAPAISVILATTSLETRFDLDKIVRFIERPPKPRLADMARVLAITRRESRNGWPRRVVDPAPKKAREVLDRLESDSDVKAWLFAVRNRLVDPGIALSALPATPRALKNTLRNVLDSWEVLAGEVDLDDLIFATALRETVPDVFAVIDDTIDAIRTGYKEPLSDRQPEQSPAWQRLLQAIDGTGPNAPLVTCIVQQLFPGLPFGRVRVVSDRDRPQGLIVDRYWERWTTGAPIPDCESDQRTLKEMEIWLADGSGAFVRQVRSPQFAERVERFIERMPTDQLGRLLTEVAALDAQESAVSWGESQYAPGVVAVYRLATKTYDRDNVALAEAVASIIEQRVGDHLPLAATLVSFFVVGDPSIPTVLPDTTRSTLRTVVESSLVEAFGGDDGWVKLADALQSGKPWFLYHLVWGLERIRANQTLGRPFAEWDRLAITLLRLAAERPAVGVPLILPFVTTSDRTHRFIKGRGPTFDWQAEFVAAQAEELFGAEAIRQVVTADPQTDDADLRARWLAVAEPLSIYEPRRDDGGGAPEPGSEV
ncbi:MAG: P-loop NTPase fold protein [Vicinamibacterales bacterium]